ncbi:YbaB/EbfC family nucleoid-associated protein [Ureaplasma ceti]|uniref:Nucleoid-associated protein UREOM_5480 n=1 Tax=Ureaplasma ceti TaxID=3119530 RepID=A0ABP9U9H6_9BACT
MNIQKMMQEAQRMQATLKRKMDEFDETEFEYSYQNYVTLKIKGSLEIVDLQINKDIIDPEDPDTLQDLIIAATNKAIHDTQAKKDEIARKVAPSLNGLI